MGNAGFPAGRMLNGGAPHMPQLVCASDVRTAGWQPCDHAIFHLRESCVTSRAVQVYPYVILHIQHAAMHALDLTDSPVGLRCRIELPASQKGSTI